MSNNARSSDSFIRINIKRSVLLDVCTCGDLYCSTEPLPMGFTLPRTRLVHGSLSYQRLGPPVTLTTWISPLNVRLTDFLEFQDATLLESLSNYIHYNTTMKSRQEFHGIMSTHTMSMFPHQNLMLSQRITISCKCTTNQFTLHFMSSTTYNSIIPSYLNIHNIIYLRL